MANRELSKSKLIAFRQCSKRLWLEVHQPQLREDSKSTKAIFKTGHEVGEIARHLYDPLGQGAIIDLKSEGVGPALERSKALLRGDTIAFEVGFAAAGAMAFADVMMPVPQGGSQAWRMVEVKSSTSVKDYYLDDVAIQAFVARASGVNLTAVALAHIDSSWIYPGNGNYQGLLVEQDLTASAFSRTEEVRQWVAAAHAVVLQASPPDVATGLQCSSPFPCGFHAHCMKGEAQAEFPVTWLPLMRSKLLAEHIMANNIADMRDVPDGLLNSLQRRVKDCTVHQAAFFDAEGAKKDLGTQVYPAYFLDFETIQFGAPRWAGTRPFQATVFQFSLHVLNDQAVLSHHEFLDLSGSNPSLAFANRLVEDCGVSGPIYVYNAGFEGSRIQELAQQFPELSSRLSALRERLVDLLPIARSRFYHPGQRGSWSLKNVLPAIAPQLRYDQLTGVQDGDMAMQGFLEAIDPATVPERKQEIELQLRNYCKLDTLAMVEIWRKFSGAQPSDVH